MVLSRPAPLLERIELRDAEPAATLGGRGASFFIEIIQTSNLPIFSIFIQQGSSKAFLITYFLTLCFLNKIRPVR